MTGEEGCSRSGRSRSSARRVGQGRARSVDGKPLAINARGLRARVLQHEIDHLDGVLFIDRVEPMLRDRIKRKIKKEGLRDDASRHAFAL
jgi:peptide deformylase